MYIPEWFKRDLKNLDPTYFIAYNDHYNYFEIKKRFHYYVKDSWGRIEERLETPNLATFKHLNEDAMTNLRKRKRMGEKFEGDTAKYIRYIQSLHRESKKKARQLRLEMMAEAFIRMYNMGKIKYFT